MNQRWWIVIAVVLAMVGFWSTRTNQSSTAVPSIKEDATASMAVQKKSPSMIEKKETSDEKPVQAQEAPHLQENFTQALAGLQTCFSFSTSLEFSDGDSSLEAWKGALRPELGDIVLEAEDWTNTHLVLANGEKRRIRIESEMGNDNRITKKLKYASVDKDDLPVPINLPEEQTTEPSETFISSLEKEGQVTMTEKAERLYYSDGTEIMTVQRNNTVSEIEITKSGKSFHCWNMDQSTHQCDCL